MEIPADRYCRTVDSIGSVVAASIPMALDVLMRSGRVRSLEFGPYGAI
jgi:3-oxoacyl-[acyl-carrier-protein] synthase III